MGLLSKEAILGAEDIITKDVKVPEWGGVMRVRAMTGTQRDAWEASMFNNDGQMQSSRMENLRAKLVVRCAIDEDGNEIFTEGDVAALGKKSAAALDRVFSACQKLNRISNGDVEELVGNSETGQPEGSTSA